jgi:cytochrome c553
MRRRTIATLAVSAVLAALALQAKPAFVPKAKEAGITNATCTTCHVKAGSKELNDVGKVAKDTMKDGQPDYAAVKKAIK